MYELKGKVALVTGAASGIGFACVKELLRNQLKNVTLVDVNAENGKKALDEIALEFGANSAIYVEADVSDKLQLEEAFEKAVKTFNQLDIVINNAGIIQELQWERCIDINLGAIIAGSILAIDKYLPTYQAGPDAIVVNMSSVAAFRSVEALPVYSATKAGVLAFTRAMGGHTRYEKSRIRIVAMCPSQVDTSMVNITEKQIPEPFLSKRLAFCKQKAVRQTPEEFAKKVMKVITDAPTGSAWLTDGDNFTQIDFSKLY